MSQLPMFTLGAKVKVVRVRDRIPQAMVDNLRKSNLGEVTGFQMTDGSGVGVVVTFADGSSNWFFGDEVSLA